MFFMRLNGWNGWFSFYLLAYIFQVCPAKFTVFPTSACNLRTVLSQYLLLFSSFPICLYQAPYYTANGALSKVEETVFLFHPLDNSGVKALTTLSCFLYVFTISVVK